MNYVIARYKEKEERVVYQSYVGNSLFYLGQLRNLPVKYTDLLNNEVEEDTRTGDEIVADIVKRAGLEVKA